MEEEEEIRCWPSACPHKPPAAEEEEEVEMQRWPGACTPLPHAHQLRELNLHLAHVAAVHAQLRRA